VDLPGFRARFPEFRTADDTLVSACLAAAAGETDSGEFGAAYDEAHGLLAAHKLAISPFGQAARMVSDKGQTTYMAEREAVTSRVITPLTVV
jgi:hypothetical protein